MHIHSHLPLLLLFHECEGVFYFLRPVLLGQRIWNTLFLLALSIGQGLMVWLYSVEYYARYFCPKEVSGSTNLTVGTYIPPAAKVPFSGVGWQATDR